MEGVSQKSTGAIRGGPIETILILSNMVGDVVKYLLGFLGGEIVRGLERVANTKLFKFLLLTTFLETLAAKVFFLVLVVSFFVVVG